MYRKSRILLFQMTDPGEFEGAHKSFYGDGKKPMAAIVPHFEVERPVVPHELFKSRYKIVIEDGSARVTIPAREFPILCSCRLNIVLPSVELKPEHRSKFTVRWSPMIANQIHNYSELKIGKTMVNKVTRGVINDYIHNRVSKERFRSESLRMGHRPELADRSSALPGMSVSLPLPFFFDQDRPHKAFLMKGIETLKDPVGITFNLQLDITYLLVIEEKVKGSKYKSYSHDDVLNYITTRRADVNLTDLFISVKTARYWCPPSTEDKDGKIVEKGVYGAILSARKKDGMPIISYSVKETKIFTVLPVKERTPESMVHKMDICKMLMHPCRYISFWLIDEDAQSHNIRGLMLPLPWLRDCWSPFEKVSVKAGPYSYSAPGEEFCFDRERFECTEAVRGMHIAVCWAEFPCSSDITGTSLYKPKSSSEEGHYIEVTLCSDIPAGRYRMVACAVQDRRIGCDISDLSVSMI